MPSFTSVRTTLFRLRHVLGAVAAVAVAWSPFLRGNAAYQPMADHGECGFLCMFLIAAVFWWIVGILAGAAAWVGFALLARLIRPNSAEQSR